MNKQTKLYTSDDSSNIPSEDRFGFFCRLNIVSSTFSGKLNLDRSIFVFVAITYDCGTLRSGTPFTLYGPIKDITITETRQRHLTFSVL